MILLELSDESAVHVLEPVALVDDNVTPLNVTEEWTIVHRDLVRRDEDGHGGARGCEALQLLDLFQPFTNNLALFLFLKQIQPWINLRSSFWLKTHFYEIAFKFLITDPQ